MTQMRTLFKTLAMAIVAIAAAIVMGFEIYKEWTTYATPGNIRLHDKAVATCNDKQLVEDAKALGAVDYGTVQFTNCPLFNDFNMMFTVKLYEGFFVFCGGIADYWAAKSGECFARIMGLVFTAIAAAFYESPMTMACVSFIAIILVCINSGLVVVQTFQFIGKLLCGLLQSPFSRKETAREAGRKPTADEIVATAQAAASMSRRSGRRQSE